MRRIIAFTLAIMLMAWSAGGALAVVYGEAGYLTEGYDEESAWEIDSVETLIKVRNDINNGTMKVGKYYKLTADLDISSYTDWEPIGKNSDYPFKGFIDGGGHTVKIDIVKTDQNIVGLFGLLHGGAIKNLCVTGNIRVAMVSNTNNDCHAGGIVGWARNSAIIDGCKFDGKIAVSGSTQYRDYFAGGIVGYVNSYSDPATITNNSVGSKNASTSIKSLYSYESNSNTYAGGIIGHIYNYNANTKVTGNYSRVTTSAGHIKTLTYGDRYSDRGTFSDNKEENGEPSSVYPSAVVYGEEGYLTEGYDEESAWQIDSVETLIKVRNDINNGTVKVGKYYKLTADLDISSYTDWEPIGKNTDYPFKGFIDCGSHTVKIDIVKTDQNIVGLFGLVHGGTIKNLCVTGNIRAAMVSNTNNDCHVGGIVGWARNSAIIDGCKFDGKIAVSGSTQYRDYYAGGIVGYVNSYSYPATITNNSVGSKNASTSIKSLYSYESNNNTYAGGIIGYIYNYNADTKVTGNYSRVATDAGHVKTLTYGDRYSDRGTFSDNVEVDPSAPDPEPVVPAPTITTASLPDAVNGIAYSVQLAATGEGTITWAVSSGILPDGLTVSSTGLLSGTPTETGTFTITVKAENSGGKDTKSLSLTVTNGSEYPPLKIITESLPNGKVGKAYEAIIHANNDNYVMASIIRGLPDGLNYGTGNIFGTPTTAGTYTVKVNFSDGYTDAFADLTLVIEPADTTPVGTRPTITTTEIPSATKDVPYSVILEATGDTPITWSAVEAELPVGLTLNASTGELSGTVTGVHATSGPISFAVTATNAAGSVTRTFTLNFIEAASTIIAPVITTKSDLGTFKVGEEVSIRLEATGTEPITWRVTAAVPDGILEPLPVKFDNGLLSGVPTTAGKYEFTVRAWNDAGESRRTFTMTVVASSPSTVAPEITTSEDLGKFDAGKRVSIALKATGTSPIAWKAEGLPEGLNISSTGLIYGTVTAADTYMFTVTATNTAGEDAKNFTLTIEPATIAPVITSAQDLGTYEFGKEIDATQIEATGTAPITWKVTGLPAGLAFDAETATLSGKTEKTGDFTFTITASNAIGKDSRKFTLKVKVIKPDVIAPTISTDSLPVGQEGDTYNAMLEADGTAPITWTITGLPDGLKPYASGKIAGAPKVGGTFTVNVTATNSEGSDTKEYTLVIAESNKITPPKIATETLDDATAGEDYSFELKAEGKNVTWTATFKTLQNFRISNEGVLSGKPTAAGIYNITVKAKNSAGTDYANLTLKVNDKPNETKQRPVIQSSKLPDAFNGEEYSYFLEAEGTVKTWKLPDGPDSLPTGLELLPSGEITGTPNSSKVKTFKFKVVATNEAGDSDPKTISLKVIAKTPEFKELALKEAKWNKKYSYTVKVLNMKPTVWSIDGDLPEGLKFDKGKFSGKPMEVGEFEFTITASNGATELTDYFTLNVKGVDPKIKGSFKKGNEGEEYSATLKATGVTPMTWDIEDLPDGLDYTPSATGEECIISGVPQTTFNGKVTVKVSNGSGDEETSVSKGLKMSIKALKPKFATKAINVENGYVDTRYSFQLELSTKSTEVVWSYTGDMPDGLTLDEDSGLLYGMPIKEEIGRFIVFAANANKPSYKAKLQIAMEILPKSEAPKSDTDPEPEPEPEQPEFVNGIAYHERGELTNETLATIARNDEVIAAVLPALEVEEAGMYDFTVSLDVNAPEGGLLVWHSFPDGEDDDGDDENAVFLDENGEVFERVPETYSVTVSAWLEPGVIYEPIIAVKISE